MTEAEWLACAERDRMLTLLTSKKRPLESMRKSRLFAAACCWRVEHLLADKRCQRLFEEAVRFGVLDGQGQSPSLLRQAIAEVEGWADGSVRPGTLDEAAETAEALSRVSSDYYGCYDPSWGPVDHDLIATCEAAQAVSEASADGLAVLKAAASTARAVARMTCKAPWGEDADDEDPTEVAAQCHVLRDVFGNPFRHVTSNPSWQRPAVIALAGAAYDNRILPGRTLELDRLAVLSDALEEAGCTDTAILAHLRSPGPHVRGCWALDLILGRS